MKCSVCKQDGHNKRTCKLDKSNTCIICLDKFVNNDVINTTCCSQVICKNCYIILLENKSVDCPNCRSYFNSKCKTYNEIYLNKKVSESIISSRNDDMGFLTYLDDFEKLCKTIYENDCLMSLAFTKYIYLLRSELLFYTTNCYITNIPIPLSIIDLSYLLARTDAPALLLEYI